MNPVNEPQDPNLTPQNPVQPAQDPNTQPQVIQPTVINPGETVPSPQAPTPPPNTDASLSSLSTEPAVGANSGNGMPQPSPMPQATKSRWKRLPHLGGGSKKLKVIIAALIILLAGGAAAYFLYYVPNKPSNVWKTALTRSGKGYDNLVAYATKTKNINAVDVTGTFKTTGDIAADGTLSGGFGDGNGKLTVSASAMGLKTGLDLLWIKSANSTPDIYFKLSGVKGLGDMVVSLTGAQNFKKLNDVNDQWYLIDHSLFDQFASGSNSTPQLSSKDVNDFLTKVGNTSKKYLFTGDTSKSSLVLKQYLGSEVQEGRKVYHYKIGYNKQNLKAYFKELCSDIDSSKLQSFGSFFDASGTLGCESQTYSYADQLNGNETADAWVDKSTKLIHKIRFPERTQQQNYFEVGQNYTGGDNFPFFVNFHSKDSTDTSSGSIQLTLNEKTNSVTLVGSAKTEGSSSSSGNISLQIKPAPSAPSIKAPSNSKNILQLVSDLGLGQLLGQ